MRIDILVSVIPKGINDLEVGIEEHNLKNAIGKLLAEQGYKKFTVAGSDIINDGVKKKVNSVMERCRKGDGEMKEIEFTPIRNIYWDNHGQPTLVFVKGRVYKGELHKSGKITATTPYYDVDDFISESDIEIIE